MNKLIEEHIRSLSNDLAQELGIREVGRIVEILKRAALGWWGKELDSPEEVVQALEDPLPPVSALRDAFQNLPPREVLELFESEDPVFLYLIVEFIDGYISEPLYTYRELGHLFKEFTGYLEDNRHSLSTTGYPVEVFENSDWLFEKFSTLCPVKIPYSIALEEEVDQKPRLVYTWRKYKQRSNAPSYVECSYSETPFVRELSDREVFEFENMRATVLELKIEALNILTKSLMAGTSVGLWGNFRQTLASRLSTEDFLSLTRIEKKLFTSPHLDEIHKRSYALLGDRFWDLTRCLLKPGGIRGVVEMVKFTEKELKIGRMHHTKKKLLAINNNKEISSYYNLLLTAKLDKLWDVVREFDNYSEEDEEKNFDKVFNGRLQSDIASSFGTNQETSSVEKRLSREGMTPIELPPGTKWEDITIRFMDGETVKIKAKDLAWKRNFKDMGFANSRNLKPNVQWQFLRSLSECHGKFTWGNRRANYKLKARKKNLAIGLKQYFGIPSDPFYPYKQVKAYETKFNLILESEGDYSWKPEKDLGKFTNESLDHPYQPS